MTLSVLAINCTLKSGDKASSTALMLTRTLEEFAVLGAKTEIIRSTDFTIKPGVTSDEGEGDEWPEIRKKIVAADILLLGTPIWMGQPGSECKRILERLDAFLGETDDKQRTPAYGKVACVAVVGNEDGAHLTSAMLFQALADVGFTIPAASVVYWVGEAMGSTDYKDLKTDPEKVVQTRTMLVRNAMHLAKCLKAENYPGMEE